jgi:hypothetical protein
VVRGLAERFARNQPNHCGAPNADNCAPGPNYDSATDACTGHPDNHATFGRRRKLLSVNGTAPGGAVPNSAASTRTLLPGVMVVGTERGALPTIAW